VDGRQRLGEVEVKTQRQKMELGGGSQWTEQTHGLGVEAVSTEHGNSSQQTETWRDKGREWGLVAVVGGQSRKQGLGVKAMSMELGGCGSQKSMAENGAWWK